MNLKQCLLLVGAQTIATMIIFASNFYLILKVNM